MAEAKLVETAFLVGNSALLLLLCSSGKTMLPWKLVWGLPDPADSMCAVWCKASMLGPGPRRRARDKAERFLFSSTLLSARPVCIRVKCRSTFVRHGAHHFFGVLRDHYTRMWGPNVGRFLVRKSRVLQQRPVGLHEKTSDNIRLAKKFDRGQYDAIDCREAEGFRKFDDVRLEPYQCSVPGYNDEATAISLMWRA